MAETAHHHEFGARHHAIETSSDKSFGLVFTAFFIVVAAYFAWQRNNWLPVPLALGAAFLVLALVNPVLLAPLNWAWTRLGLLLGAIMAPIMLGIIFLAVITPMAFLARLAGKDFLRLQRDPAAPTYWLTREQQEPAPESLREQF